MSGLRVTAEVRSLLVPRVFSPTVTAEVRLLRVRRRGCESTVITGYGRDTVTAGSICEVTVITDYGSTQDDEHLCRNTMNRACDLVGYKCSKSTATYTTLLILLSKLATVSKRW
jgi:hypothetical protein